MRKCLILLLICCILPAGALAAPPTPYDAGLMLRYYTLSDAQRALFDLLYEAAQAGEGEVSLPEQTSYADAAAAMDALLMDCPELCALDNHYSIRYYQQAPDEAIAVELSYALPLSTQETLMNKARAWAAQAEGDAYARELYLHDLLLANTAYDLSADAQATAYGALIEGRAGCEGYSKALVLLCRLAGIPCGMVTGTAMAEGRAEQHAWCVLSIGGAFTLADPTWNDQPQLGNTRWYLNLTDQQMNADHTPAADIPLPPCTDATVSWHWRSGNVVPAEETAARQVILSAMERLTKENVSLNLRFADPSSAAVFVDNLNSWFDIYNEENPSESFWGSYSVAASEAQGCVIIQRGQ